MKTAIMVALAALALAAFGGLAVAAEAGAKQSVKLPLNGDFSGAASDGALAPGWTLVPDMGGSAKVVPGKEPGTFALAVRATEDKGQSVISDFIPIDGAKPGDWLRIIAKCDGTGDFAVRALWHDASKAVISRGVTSIASTKLGLMNFANPLPAEARFFRVELMAPPGATIRFLSVATMFEPRPETVKPAKDGSPAPVIMRTVRELSGDGVGDLPRTPAPVVMRTVREGESFPYDALEADEHFAVRSTVGKAFKFSLGGPHEGLWDKLSLGFALFQEYEVADPADPGKLSVTITPRVEGTSAFVIGCRDKTVTVHCTATK